MLNERTSLYLNNILIILYCMSYEVTYLVGYGSYLDPDEVRTVIESTFVSHRARIAGFMRVFNLPHDSYRYPIRGNLKGVMNAIPSTPHHMNVMLIAVPTQEDWDRIEKREGKMYDKIEVEAHLTDEDYAGETLTAVMFIGKPDRINVDLYPLPEYYGICRTAAENLGDSFLSEYLETTFMQANGAFLSLKTYEDNMAGGRRPDDFTRMTGTIDSVCANVQGVPFSQISAADQVEIKRDYYLEELARNVVFNDSTNKLYLFAFERGKIEFYRANLGFDAHLGDQSIWAAYERGVDVTKGVDIFFDTRKNIPFSAIQPFKIVIDRKIIKHPSLAIQTVAQVILGTMNPMTLQPWSTGSDGVQMIWRHYMNGMLNTAMTIERHVTDINLLGPEFLTDWEPGSGTAVEDTFLPSFSALSAITSELVTRRELVQFPVQLPINYESDYREESNRGAFWRSWMWFYSKWDSDTGQVFTFAKFEDEVDEKDFVQICMANTSNKIKYKRRIFSDGYELKYIMTPLRNYTTEFNVDIVDDTVLSDDYDDLIFIEEGNQ